MDYKKALDEDIAKRIARIQTEMASVGVEACVLTTLVNLFYVAGEVYNGYCYIPVEGKPIHFLKRTSDTILDQVVYIRKPEQIIEELQQQGYAIPRKIFLELDVIAYSECTRLVSSFGNPEIANASVTMRRLRSVKSEFEIAQIRLCARQHEAVYKEIPTVFRRGMTDLELQFEIEHLMRKHGSIGWFRSYGSNMDIYMGSLLAGENAEEPSPFDFALGGKGGSAVTPLGASGVKIKEGDAIMVDMAGNYKPWMTDMTRVFSCGKTTDLAYRTHQVSIDIHNCMIDMAKPGVACSELYNLASEIVKQHDLEPYFMGTKLQAKFVGHGVGLEINEPPVLTPRSKELLESGVVFAYEPKFVIPQVGAVGVENTYLVTETSLEKLTILEEEIIEL